MDQIILLKDVSIYADITPLQKLLKDNLNYHSEHLSIRAVSKILELSRGNNNISSRYLSFNINNLKPFEILKNLSNKKVNDFVLILLN
jgi:hypothetical protein